MSEVSHSLYVKYGLGHRPTASEVEAWVKGVEALIRAGTPQEEAGHRAASQLFEDYNRFGYKSQADTIEMLLSQAKSK